MDELTVTIPLERYNELLGIKTRMDILTERVLSGRIEKEDILRVIGSRLAIQEADKIRKKENWEREEFCRRVGAKDD